jgi:pimeloyl-ACP methyl ester carboxylesterase
MVHVQSWGAGRPLIALHGLGLESTCFAGLGERLARHGIRTLSADLPGFGKTRAPQGPLTLRRMAEPVIDFAAELEDPPLLLGMSLGGRVALEAALRAPDVFRGLVLVSPALPLRYIRWAGTGAWLLNPGLAERVPVEILWPLLRRLAEMGDSEPGIEDDWLTRAGKRAIYYMACPATRAAFVGAIRALATDPTSGPESVWRRLSSLAPPAVFVWGSRDRMVSPKLEQPVAKRLPGSVQLRVPCAGHYFNGRHFRCHLEAMAGAALHLDARSGEPKGGEVLTADCVAEAEPSGSRAGSPA